MNVSALDVRLLVVFDALMSERHVTRAATRLHLSQPALSKSLRRLEQMLEVKLFNRTAKGVELTPEGSMLLLRVRELRLSLQSVAREVADGEARLVEKKFPVVYRELAEFGKEYLDEKTFQELRALMDSLDRV